MPVPNHIKASHIESAIRDINEGEIPKNRSFERYYLSHEGKKYPVKYVISLANKYSGEKRTMLSPLTFNTYEAQDFLTELGYKIVDQIGDQLFKYTGFKLISLTLLDNTLLGSIRYSFIDDADGQDQIYTTVIIGPNGTGKSNLFRIIIELFRELYNLSKGNARTYNVDGQFDLKYSLHGDIYSFTNIINIDLNVDEIIKAENGKQLSYVIKNGELIDNNAEILIPSDIVANSIMLTDKYPVYTDPGVFPQYKYLGVRTTAQNASTRSYVRRTVDYIISEKDSSAFRKGLSRITNFLGIHNSIEVYYTTINAPLFFKGDCSADVLEKYFNEIADRYKDSEYPPQKLNNYLNIRKNNRVKAVSDFCNKLYNEDRLEWIKKGSSVRKIVYNITDERSFQMLKEESVLLEELRQIGLLYAPDIFLKRDDSYSLQESSSGEYHFFSSMVALMATVKSYSLIFLDEPEISLHPNWQMKYISFVRDLFADSNYNTSHILMATHSHFLISDLDGRDSKIIGLKKSAPSPTKKNSIEIVDLPKNIDTYGWSAEDVLFNVFDVVTVRNKYVADVIGDILEEMSKGSKREINKLEQSKYELLIRLQASLKEIDPLKQVVDSILKHIR